MHEAIEVLREWARLEPSNPTAAHLLAACSQTEVPDRASDGFVRAAFDALAETFDDHLRDLEYRAPDLVAAAIRSDLGAAHAALDVLDAGCGTGLCGAFLRSYARRLVGVDAMVCSLSAKGLTHGEISAHLAEIYGAGQKFELVNGPEGGLCVRITIPFSISAP